MAVGFVQAKGNGNGGGTATTSVTLDAPATVGNVLVVAFRGGNSQTLNTPTDDKSGGSHTYTSVIAQVNNGSAPRVRMFYAVVTGAVSVVTCTTGGNTAIEASVVELSGVNTSDPFGLASSGTGSSTTPSVTSFSPTAGNAIVAFLSSTGAIDTTPGTGYTIGNDGTLAGSMYRLVCTGTETAPATITINAAWAEIAAEFKVAPQTIIYTARRSMMGVGR